MKSTQLINILESYQTYQELKKDMEDIFKQVTFDPVKDKTHVDQINGNIACFISSSQIEQEDFDKVCEFQVDLASTNLHDLYHTLKELQDEEKELSGMAEAWDSGDECAMACNDPGLQYEQGERVEELWRAFELKYNKK